MTTEERLDKAQARYDKAAKLHWERLGWGTSAEVASALERMTKARVALDKVKKTIGSQN